MLITVMKRVTIFLIMLILSLIISNIFRLFNHEIIFFFIYIFINIISTLFNISKVSDIEKKCMMPPELKGGFALTIVLVQIGTFILQIILAVIGSKIFEINFFLLFEIIIFSNCLSTEDYEIDDDQED